MKLGNKLVHRSGLGLLGLLLLAGLAYVFMRTGPMAPTRVKVHTVDTASVAATDRSRSPDLRAMS